MNPHTANIIKIARPGLAILVVCLVLFNLYVVFVPKSYIATFFFNSDQLYNIDLAEFFYRQAIQYDRDEANRPEPYVHYQLGRIAFLSGNFAWAYRELFKELEYYPNNDHTYYTLGLVYGYDKQEEKAIEAFKKFLDYKPGSWAARNDLAWLQFRIGDIAGAVATIKPAVQFTEPNPWILNTYGVLLMNQGDLAGAKTALTQAMALAEEMESSDWGKAYPGNHPAIYDEGLDAMRNSIKANLSNIEARLVAVPVDKTR